MIKYRPISPSLSLITMFALSTSLVHAQQPNAANLDTIVVIGKNKAKPGQNKLSSRQLNDQLIMDSRDLVRYQTDIGVSEQGRFGSKGFAMRGLDGNRVAINIDGMAQADFEENTPYKGYGYFNDARPEIESELIKSVALQKGANSVDSGSGALGGSVNYQTKDIHDILIDGRQVGAYVKGGFSGKNKEWLSSFGAAATTEQFEAMVLHAHRQGHELQNFGRGNRDYKGSARGWPDPMNHRQNSLLAKFGWRINSDHKLSISHDRQSNVNHINELSFDLLPSQYRHADDRTTRTSYGLTYAYTPDSNWLEHLTLQLKKQTQFSSAYSTKTSIPYNMTEPELDAVYDRQMRTQSHLIDLSMAFEPLNTERLGQHQVSLKAGLGKREFKNSNRDFEILSGEAVPFNDSIQYPVHTHTQFLALRDHINTEAGYFADLGLRYDRLRFKPQRDDHFKPSLTEALPQTARFDHLSWQLAVGAQLTPIWQIRYQLANGFRAPTASEMYFEFNRFNNWFRPNPDLKPEKALNHELTLMGENQLGNLTFSGFYSRYRDFIVERHQDSQVANPYYDPSSPWGGAPFYTVRTFTHTNLDRASIKGLEFNGRLNLDQLGIAPAGLSLMGGFSYSRNHTSDGTHLLSAQPFKAILGLSYEPTHGNWVIHSKANYFGAKQSDQAQWLNPRGGKLDTYPYLNQSATVIDVYGHKKVSKHTIVRAGIFNLFNREYTSWDALRGINIIGSLNGIDRDGKGLSRFTSPKRYFSVSLESRF